MIDLRIIFKCILVLGVFGCGDNSSSSENGSTLNPDKYTINTSVTNGGLIQPNVLLVQNGNSADFLLTPNDGYQISNVTGCNGSLIGNKYTIYNITNSCQVSATFTPISYDIIAIAEEGGSISPEVVNINYGEEASFTVTPKEGYQISTVTGCNGSLSSGKYTTDKIKSSCQVSATFSPVSYELTAIAEEGGSISPEVVNINYGEETSFTVTPNEGYQISTITGCNGSLNEDKYIIGRVVDSCKVTAKFSKLVFTIPVEVQGEGTTSSQEINVEYGNNIDFITFPSDGYGVYKIDGCRGNFDSNHFRSIPIKEYCEMVVVFEPEINGYVQGPSIVIENHEALLSLILERDVEVTWNVTNFPENSDVIIEPLEGGKVKFSSNTNGTYEVSVNVQRGYLEQEITHEIKVATELSENIESDTYLLESESPYFLTKDIYIRQGSTLSSAAGVELYGNDRSITVFGGLNFQGESNKKIKIESLHVNPGSTSYDGPHFIINFSNVYFERGSFYSPTGNAIYGAVDVRNSIFKNVGEHIYLWYPESDVSFVSNQFLNSGGISFGVSGKQVNIENNLFFNPLGDGYVKYAINNWANYNNADILIRNNSFYTNDSVAVMLSIDGYFDAINNYWNTQNEDKIKSMIIDVHDDPKLKGEISFMPYLTEPHPETPMLDIN